MTKILPVSAAKDIVAKYGQQQVVVATWDGELTHIVTYGMTDEDRDQAADGGNFVKKALGWPKHLEAEPSRYTKMRETLADMKFQIKRLEKLLNKK